LKVLIISKHIAGAFKGEFYYPGEWVRTFELIKALAAKGVNMTLVTPRPAPNHQQRFGNEFGKILADYQIKHYKAPTYVTLGSHGGSFRLRMFLAELRALVRERPDIIAYMQFGPSLLYHIPNRPPITFFSCYKPIPVKYTGQDIDASAKRHWSVNSIRDFQAGVEDKIFAALNKRWGASDVVDIVKKSEAIVIWHPSGYQNLKSSFPKLEKIFLIPKGVDISACKNIEYLENSSNVLFMGFIGERKGIFTLLEAFRSVNHKIPTARLIIAGSGPPELVKKMLQIIDTYGLNAKYVESIPHSKKWRFLKQGAIFCLPSSHDTYPAAILEAMACSLPVITTDIIDTRVEDGVTGFLIPPDSPDVLAQKIIHLLRNSETRRCFGQRARKVAELYDWNIIADRIIKDVVRPLVLSRGSEGTKHGVSNGSKRKHG
jgi:glycosyltransferase involved in cell wall biosynthesis